MRVVYGKQIAADLSVVTVCVKLSVIGWMREETQLSSAADAGAFPPKLPIRCRVNGELRQDSTTDMLIFGIDHIISDLSRGMTLRAGTIISTGTPSGVGMGFDPPKFLRAGDTVRCEIGGIGTLTNPIVD